MSPEELAALLENLPQNLDERGKAVVTAAYSLIGKVNYFWGGKSTAMGWDSCWGTPAKVTSSGSSSSGTVRPFGLDCSGYVTWFFCNGAGTADAVNIIKHGSRNQYAACHKISWSELQPGDLVFFNFSSPHVGIIIGKNQMATSSLRIVPPVEIMLLSMNIQGRNPVDSAYQVGHIIMTKGRIVRLTVKRCSRLFKSIYIGAWGGWRVYHTHTCKTIT